MAKTPERSQMDVFLEFMAELAGLQKQLDIRYLGDRYLRDELLASVDLLDIQKSLSDRTPRTSEQAIKRIANGLSGNKRTAGF